MVETLLRYRFVHYALSSMICSLKIIALCWSKWLQNFQVVFPLRAFVIFSDGFVFVCFWVEGGVFGYLPSYSNSYKMNGMPLFAKFKVGWLQYGNTKVRNVETGKE